MFDAIVKVRVMTIIQYQPHQLTTLYISLALSGAVGAICCLGLRRAPHRFKLWS